MLPNKESELETWLRGESHGGMRNNTLLPREVAKALHDMWVCVVLLQYKYHVLFIPFYMDIVDIMLHSKETKTCIYFHQKILDKPKNYPEVGIVLFISLFLLHFFK